MGKKEDIVHRHFTRDESLPGSTQSLPGEFSSHDRSNQPFHILSINVGGLRNKLYGPDFEDFIKHYSVICIQETHFDRFDNIDIPGFQPLPFMNRDRARIRSGGIAVLVKDEVFDKVTVLKSSGEYFYWFTLLNCFSVDLLFCSVYIPPEGSTYGAIDIFDSLESDLIELNPQNEYQICLLGDFNAHTNNDNDFISIDDTIEQTLHIENFVNDIDRVSIQNFGFPLERFNTDHSRIDNYGRRLLDICKSFNLYIANGRLGDDRSLGTQTCRGSTVVDYAILSPSVFNMVNDFRILPFDPLLSDVHSGIHNSLCCQPENILLQEINTNESDTITRASWNASAQDLFL